MENGDHLPDFEGRGGLYRTGTGKGYSGLDEPEPIDGERWPRRGPSKMNHATGENTTLLRLPDEIIHDNLTLRRVHKSNRNHS